MNCKSWCMGLVLISAGIGLQVVRGQDVPAKPATRPAAPALQPRTSETASTPAIKDSGRNEFFISQMKQHPVNLLLLGDSITDAWPNRGSESWTKLAEYKPFDAGISGDRTENVLWRITHGGLEGITPKVTVIMIGTNNIGMDKPQWIAAGVTKIVETVHEKLPKTKVLLLAILPRGVKASATRKEIEAVNGIISKLDDGRKTFYLDIGGKFLDDTGEVAKDVTADGVHPSAKGYEIWYEAMRPKLSELMK